MLGSTKGGPNKRCSTGQARTAAPAWAARTATSSSSSTGVLPFVEQPVAAAATLLLRGPAAERWQLCWRLGTACAAVRCGRAALEAWTPAGRDALASRGDGGVFA
jgi:hypothetical protein